MIKMNFFVENFDAKIGFATKKVVKDGKTFMQVEKPNMTFNASG